MKGFLKKGHNLLINDKQINPFFQQTLIIFTGLNTRCHQLSLVCLPK